AAQQTVNDRTHTLHLEHLPNGLYTVVAHGNDQRLTAKFSIQH
ncbi:MAG: T9SS type A sorting domain-containing protein, partial [Flavobacteriales bacterium]|nr:T9SS type A sorting domain-containing protein [Flavobacteriales bacterium]